MTFDSYQEFLKFTYNSLHAEGKIVEVIELVKSQAKGKPFDYEYCTVEGGYFYIFILFRNHISFSSDILM